MILINPNNNKPLQETQEGYTDNETIFPKVNGVYKLISSTNYTSNFGFQWKKFKNTQLDKFSGQTTSKDRFFEVTGWIPETLNNENILEAGCGAGRFTQIVLDYTNANLYSLDYSDSVEANFENNGPNERLKIFQASIYQMPFAENSFDKVFCFGVLQHTPDIAKTIACLYHVLKPGGELIIDFYPYKGFWTKIHSKYLLRPFVKNMDHKKLLSKIEANIDWMISASNFFNKIGVGKLFNRFIPICDIAETLPPNLTSIELREWAILDTFDMFSPAYDQPQKVKTVKEEFETLGMKNVFGGYMSYSGKLQAPIVKGIK